MKRSRGRISKKSRVLGRKSRSRIVTPAKLLKKIDIGEKVQIVPHARFEDHPSPRFSGRIGKVVGKRGRAYIVEVKDGGKIKKIIATPIHLKILR